MSINFDIKSIKNEKGKFMRLMKKLEIENRDKLSENSNLRRIIEGFRNAKFMVGVDGVNTNTKIVFDYIC